MSQKQKNNIKEVRRFLRISKIKYRSTKNAQFGLYFGLSRDLDQKEIAYIESKGGRYLKFPPFILFTNSE